LINIPTHTNAKLKKVLTAVNKHEELNTLWEASNIMLVDRMGYTDHGKVHVAIVSNIALKLFRMLDSANVEFSSMKYYKLSKEDAEIIVFLGAVLHDIGNSVHRQHHESTSVVLATNILPDLLKGYDARTKTIITTEVLHALICHEKGYPIKTLEAGIVRVADALDMKEGRARIPFHAGCTDIHAVSAMAVKDIKLENGMDKGTKKPILVTVTLSNSAGIFQIDSLFKEKLTGSLLEPYITIQAKIDGETEQRILKEYCLG